MILFIKKNETTISVMKNNVEKLITPLDNAFIVEPRDNEQMINRGIRIVSVLRVLVAAGF